MTEIGFKPCPFCGSTDIEVKSEVLDRRMGSDAPCSALTRCFARCKYCGAEGPKRTGDIVYEDEKLALAVEGWNKRNKE